MTEGTWKEVKKEQDTFRLKKSHPEQTWVRAWQTGQTQWVIGNGMYVLGSTDALAHCCCATGLTLVLPWSNNITLTVINLIISPIRSDTQQPQSTKTQAVNYWASLFPLFFSSYLCCLVLTLCTALPPCHLFLLPLALSIMLSQFNQYCSLGLKPLI